MHVVAFTVFDDAEDLDALEKHVWRLNGGYVQSAGKTDQSRGTGIFLHRWLLNLPTPRPEGDDREVDHIDGDPFNNHRSNLRVVKHSENTQNVSGVQKSSKYRGVCQIKKSGRWRAYSKADGQWIHLGVYPTEEEAAKVASDFRLSNMPFTNEDRRVA